MPTELQHWCLQQIGSTWHIKLISSQIHSSVLEDPHEEKTQSPTTQVKEAMPFLVWLKWGVTYSKWTWQLSLFVSGVEETSEDTQKVLWSVNDHLSMKSMQCSMRPEMGNFMGKVVQPFPKKTPLQVIKLGLWIRDRWNGIKSMLNITSLEWNKPALNSRV